MRKNIVSRGATAFKFPNEMPMKVRHAVANKDLFPFLSFLNMYKNGSVPSAAIACNNLVADTKLCNHHPIVLHMTPYTTRLLNGTDAVAVKNGSDKRRMREAHPPYKRVEIR